MFSFILNYMYIYHHENCMRQNVLCSYLLCPLEILRYFVVYFGYLIANTPIQSIFCIHILQKENVQFGYLIFIKMSLHKSIELSIQIFRKYSTQSKKSSVHAFLFCIDAIKNCKKSIIIFFSTISLKYEPPQRCIVRACQRMMLFVACGSCNQSV